MRFWVGTLVAGAKTKTWPSDEHLPFRNKLISTEDRSQASKTTATNRSIAVISLVSFRHQLFPVKLGNLLILLWPMEIINMKMLHRLIGFHETFTRKTLSLPSVGRPKTVSCRKPRQVAS